MRLFRKKQGQSMTLLWELANELKAGPRPRMELIKLFEGRGRERANVVNDINRLIEEGIVVERPFCGPDESPSRGSYWLELIVHRHSANLAV